MVETVTVKVVNTDKELVYPVFTSVHKVMSDIDADGLAARKYACVLVNNQIYSLNDRVDINCTLEPITFNTLTGSNVYRRSLSFVLAMAAHQLFPDRKLVISHSIGHGLYYYFDGAEASAEDIRLLQGKMTELVEASLTIKRHAFAYDESLSYFAKAGLKKTLLLLEHKNDHRVLVNICADYVDLWVAPLVENTGYLSVFSIEKYQEGLLIRYPSSENCSELVPFVDNPTLYKTYVEHQQWGKFLGVDCVGQLNHIILRSEIKDFIHVAESLHDGKTASIAEKIPQTCKLVCICGPSSSGKTTFSRKLAIALRTRGWKPITISLDDYYVNRVDTPLDENGNYDFETVEALDLVLLNNDFAKLFRGETITLPKFNFKTGCREVGGQLSLPERGILIIEGIHGLNPRLTAQVDDDVKFKIFISPLSQLNLDERNRISTSDNRLIRRMVRDKQFRGYSAAETFRIWPSVRRGEDKWIYKFQGEADAVFNSALDYELAALKILAVPLLQQIKPNSIHFSEARRLLDFFANFHTIMPDDIPLTSILREFIGNGAFGVH
ncbi:hypothetical protein RCL1_004396 [Eukaryota sp. TZLM3-RCL]